MGRLRWGPGYYLEVYRAHLKLGVAIMLQYRFAVLIWGVWGFVGPLVSLAIWNAAVSSRGGAIVNEGNGAVYSQADFAAYFLTFMVFGHLMMSWDAFEYGYRVRTGSLSPLLLRPVHPIHHDAPRNLSFKLVTSVMLLPVWLLLAWLLKPTLPAAGPAVLLAIPALLLGMVLRYIWQYALALLAFWTTRVEAVQQLYFGVDAFLGGRVAPVALLPGWLGAAAAWSPFPGMGSFPVELALGRVPAAEILPGFLAQILWLGIGLVVLRALWGAGLRQYSAVGA
ncbi:MAG: hypothetical protein FJX77_06545 [Armatimonadetes bacterium]|nr:hypothetical protein [Armatimonadota bacterium]